MEDNFERLGKFTQSVGAARILLKRAHDEGFLIEGLVLYASLIDAFCRIALVLTSQLATKTPDFDLRYIYQETEKDYFSERAIYQLTLDNHIIDQSLFDEINALYGFRNKVIHRFFISDIEYAHIGIVLDRYELVYQRLFTLVYELESQQISKGVGMTVLGKTDEEDKRSIFNEVVKKIDSQNVEVLKTVLGDKLIADVGSFSEVGERARISEEISDEIEIQKEKSKIPPGYASVKEITVWARRQGYFQKCSCGHEKIHHIDTKTQYLQHCASSGCECILFAEG